MAGRNHTFVYAAQDEWKAIGSNLVRITLDYSLPVSGQSCCELVMRILEQHLPNPIIPCQDSNVTTANAWK